MYIAIATRYRKNLINFTMAESIGSLRTNIIAIKPMNVITNWAHRRAMARRHRCDHHTFNSRSFVTGRIVILISCIQRQGSGDPTPCGGYPGPHCWEAFSFFVHWEAMSIEHLSGLFFSQCCIKPVVRSVSPECFS
jgi:hypothetical protein